MAIPPFGSPPANITKLLPSQTGNAGKFLETNGSTLSWISAGLPSQTGNAGKVLQTDGTNATWQVPSQAFAFFAG